VTLPRPPVLVITDRRRTGRPLEDFAGAVFAGGCRWLSLREKDLPAAERLALAERLVRLGERRGATVTVHGDLAAAALADGVHLPRGGDVVAARDALGKRALIGVSAHDLGEAEAAAAAGADYVTLSPIFASLSKPGHGAEPNLTALRSVSRTVPVPVLALGGVTAANAADCRRAGAAGIAVIGAVAHADDPAWAARALISAFFAD
jgi:thiamine-phosphate pyrophosphorylase